MSMRASIVDLLTPKGTKASCFPRGSVPDQRKGCSLQRRYPAVEQFTVTRVTPFWRHAEGKLRFAAYD